MRHHFGNPPEDGTVVATFTHDPDKTRWVLYARPAVENSVWFPYKLVADPSAPNKGNYWFSVGPTGWFSRNREIAVMKDHRPTLLDQVNAYFDPMRARAGDPPTAPSAEPKATPAAPIGVLRDIWDVAIIPDPLDWDTIVVTKRSDGHEERFGWDGRSFRDDEAWRAWSSTYAKAAPALERMLRENDCN